MKRKIVAAAGAVMVILSACEQTESVEETQKDAGSLTIEKMDNTDMMQETQTADQTDTSLAEDKESENKEAEESSATPESGASNNLYDAFLKNEISVTNPYVEGMDLTVMDDKKYESEFENVAKKYAYVDVNSDDSPELIFKISSDTSELMYVLGIYDNKLICFDVFETHTRNISFSVYDYGLIWEIRDYDGFEKIFYSYTEDGQQMVARRFTEENEADLAAYEGEEPKWITLQ